MTRGEMADSPTWQVVLDPGHDEVYHVLSKDRRWNCFAIADLEPPFREYSRYGAARHRDTGEMAACLVLEHPSIRVISPFGAEEGVDEILQRIELPDQAFLQTQVAHRPALEQYYTWRSGPNQMLRMAVDEATFRPTSQPPSASPQRLGLEDLSGALALYELFPENSVNADQLEHGVFFGIREGDRLVAVGGTHAVAHAYGIAVLGGIFTHPDRRRRGYARAITAALVTTLMAGGCCDVVLNVVADNHPAIRVYTGLGFRTHTPYVTGQAARRRGTLLAF